MLWKIFRSLGGHKLYKGELLGFCSKLTLNNETVKERATRPYFETYTIYSGLDNEEQKKILSIFNCSFLRNLVGGGNSLFISLKGAL